MKVNVAVAGQNSADWDRIEAGAYDQPVADPDPGVIAASLALGDMVEPLGFDGIWVPEHFGTPYGMVPNPLQTLAYYAGRTERVSLGTMVIVLPWWNPIRLAHQIAYVDILSKGRFDTIGLGRGTAKTEFDAVGVPREESRERFEECLDIIELALTTSRFSYEGNIFKIPENSLRPEPITRDLPSRFHGASSTNTSLEVMARRGLRPLFVGNKPMEAAARDVLLVNSFRQEEGLPPCQGKNILFMYCAKDQAEVDRAEEYINSGNRDVFLHYGFGDANAFKGVKGYEAYAAAQAAATSLTADNPQDGGAAGKPEVGTNTTYDRSNLLVGTPDQIIERIQHGQKICGFSEIGLVPQFGTMPWDKAGDSLRLFAQEVLPVVHAMDAPLQPGVIPAPGQTAASVAAE